MTTAPTGISSRTEAARASRSAACIPVRSLGEGVPLRTGHLWDRPRSPLCLLEPQRLPVPLHPDYVALVEVALEELQRDRVLQQPLNDALERTSAIYGIVSLGGQQRLGLGSDLDGDMPLLQHLLEPIELQIDDLDEVFTAELPEHDDIVHPVEKLGAEVVPKLVAYPLLHPLPAAGIQLRTGIHDVLA